MQTNAHKHLKFSAVCIFGLLAFLAACQSTQTPSAPPPSPTASPTATITATPSPSPTPTRTPLMVAPSYNGFTPPGALETLGKGNVECFDLSPDDQYLAVGGPGGVYFYDAETLAEIWRSPHPAYSLDFSPDGVLLAIGTDQEVRFLSTATGNDVLSYQEGINDRIDSIAFSPDGNILAAADSKRDYDKDKPGHIYLWNLDNNERLVHLEAFEAGNLDVVFSPDGQSLYILDGIRIFALDFTAPPPYDSPIEIYVNDKHYPMSVLEPIHIASFAVSPDGKTLAIGWPNVTNSPPITLVDIMTGEILSETPIGVGSSGFASIAFMPDGNLIAIKEAYEANRIHFINVTSYERVRTLDIAGLSALRPVSLGDPVPSTDGDMIVLNYDIDFIAFIDADTGEKMRILTDHTSSPLEMFFSPDSKLFAASYFGQGIIIWDVASGQPFEPPIWNDKHVISSLFCTPDGRLYAQGTDREDGSGDMYLWEFKEGEFIPTDTFEMPLETLTAECSHDVNIIRDISATAVPIVITDVVCEAGWTQYEFTDDYSALAIGYQDPVTLWDIDTGAQLQSFSYHKDWRISSIEIHGNLIAVSENEDHWSEPITTVWDLTTGELLHVFQAQTLRIDDMAFSPDGLILATNSFDGTIVLWPIGK